jgi:hypothetical protein
MSIAVVYRSAVARTTMVRRAQAPARAFERLGA